MRKLQQFGTVESCSGIEDPNYFLYKAKAAKGIVFLQLQKLCIYLSHK